MERTELRALLQATGCIEERGGFVFLCDPGSSEIERAEVAALQSAVGNPHTAISEGWLAVRTGGSGGDIKFARHDERTLSAAVAGWCAHFGLTRTNVVDVLPAHHVSGLMARVRCAVAGGRHVAWDWKRLESGDVPSLPAGGAPWVISLVPTQLHRLLGSPPASEWLRTFEIIFVGGGPVWPQLAEQAAAAKLRVSLSYGMTETAAMVCALRPDEFLAGVRSCGSPLPHARIRITADGVIAVAGESICHGYLQTAPGAPPPGDLHALRENATEAGGPGREFVTEDLGRIDERGHLHVLGRRDAVIITGGKKVQPEVVEAALRASGEFEDVAVIGVPDEEWGEVVVACHPAGGGVPNLARAAAELPAHQRPKRLVAIAEWPRMPNGKVNRVTLVEACMRG